MKVRKHPHAGMTGAKHDFVKLLGTLTGSRNHREVFSDFLELAFCALAKTTHAPNSPRAEALEARYMKLADQRKPEYVRVMPDLLGMMTAGLAERCDFLGEVSGELGALSEHIGQFFTPYSVSSLIASMTIEKEMLTEQIAAKGHFTIDEPACGAGGMLLAVADVVEEHGFDPSRHMLARATDLSAVAFQMAYVQLSVRGIPCQLFHGNTLTLETFSSEVTPAWWRFWLHHRPRTQVETIADAVEQMFEAPPIVLPAMGQLDLFASKENAA